MRVPGFDGSSICNWCVGIDSLANEARRKRIAELAALVAGKSPQSSYRGADARMTAEAAWAVAEALYEKECGR